MSILRRLAIRLGLTTTHRYEQPGRYVAWLTAPLLGVVGFVDADGEVTTSW